MRVFSRSLIAVVAGLALVSASGCAGGSTSKEGIKKFQPCTFFQPNELSSAGVDPQGEPYTVVRDEPGCIWSGIPMDLILQKNEGKTIETYQQGKRFDKFEETEVDGRTAAKMIPVAQGGQGFCYLLMDAGGGVVMLGVRGNVRDIMADPCGEASKIAGTVESRLPEE